MDASGRSDLPAAVRLAGGTSRVITLSDPRGADLGVRLSEPDPRIIPASLTETMDLLESGELKLREQVTFPLAEAPAVHAELETGVLRRKVVLRV
jgi:NADPH:quinone reductase-like Zn-dependent oxidoreductase